VTRRPQTGATLPVTHVTCPWLRLLQRLDTLATLCGDELFSLLPLLPDSFGFLRGTGPSPSYPLWALLTSLPRSQPCFVLLPMQNKKKGEFFMQRLWTPSAGSDLPPPWLSRFQTSPARHLRHRFFHLWPLVYTLGRGPTVRSPWNSSTTPSLGRGRVAPPPPKGHFAVSWLRYLDK